MDDTVLFVEEVEKQFNELYENRLHAPTGAENFQVPKEAQERKILALEAALKIAEQSLHDERIKVATLQKKVKSVKDEFKNTVANKENMITELHEKIEVNDKNFQRILQEKDAEIAKMRSSCAPKSADVTKIIRFARNNPLDEAHRCSTKENNSMGSVNSCTSGSSSSFSSSAGQCTTCRKNLQTVKRLEKQYEELKRLMRSFNDKIRKTTGFSMRCNSEGDLEMTTTFQPKQNVIFKFVDDGSIQILESRACYTYPALFQQYASVSLPLLLARLIQLQYEQQDQTCTHLENYTATMMTLPPDESTMCNTLHFFK